MTSETQCCDNVVTTLSDVATKIQRKPNVATTSCASWAILTLFSISRMVLKSYEPKKLLDRRGKAYKILSEKWKVRFSFLQYAWICLKCLTGIYLKFSTP